MEYSEFRKINVLDYLNENGYKSENRKVNKGRILKYCPVCRHKDHFIIFNDNNMYSYNNCFKGGDIIELHCSLFGLNKKDAILSLKRKYFNLMENRSNNQTKRLTINIENLNIDAAILKYYDKEICKFIIEISQGYSLKNEKVQKIIDTIILKLLKMPQTVDKFDYIQYLKIMKHEKQK